MPTETFKYQASGDHRMRPALILLLLLAAPVLALVGEPLPNAPATHDPSTIPLGGAVAPSYAITILTPPASVPGPDVALSYRHNATADRVCAATIDDYDWTLGDPRWKDPAFTKEATVPPDTVRNETFANVVSGDHVIAVYCADDSGGDAQEAFRGFTVTSGPTNASVNATVTITAPPSATGTDINVTFRHNATSQGLCDIRIDGSLIVTVIAPVSATTTYRTAVSLGSHALVVACSGQGWLANATKTFRARQNATNETFYYPVLALAGGGTAVKEYAPFTVLGSGFPPGIASLTLTGNGATEEGEVESDGAFSIDYDGLPAGSYRLTARSGDSLAVLLLAINATVVVPPVEPPEEPDIVPDEPPVEQPEEKEPVYPAPEPFIEQPSGSRWWLWLLPLIVILLLVGGTAAYLAHEGMLDLTSWDGFTRSVAGLTHGRRSALPARPPTTDERRTLVSFITKERHDGADDLAIRSALIAKGWGKAIVDAVFDELYRKK